MTDRIHSAVRTPAGIATASLRAVRWVVALWLFAPLASLPAADPEATFWQGLLERGLTQAAEHEALRQLAAPQLDPDERVTWSIRLAQAYSRHAAELEGSDGEALALRAERTLSELLNLQPPLARRAEVETQLVLLRARRPIALAAQRELQGDDALRPGGDPTVAAANQELREARTRLAQHAEAAGQRTAAPAAAGELSVGAARRLQRDVELQLAAGLVAWIESAAPGADRAAAESEADRLLQALADGWIGELHTWEARLLRVRLARLRGETDHAVGLVRTALQDQPAAWIEDRLLAEQARALLTAGRLDVALEFLLTHARARGRLADELTAVQVATLVQARRLAEQRGDAATADALWQQAEAAAASAAGAWGAAAQGTLAREREAAKYGDDVARLVQAARRAYQASETDAALQLFQQAADRAVAAGRPLAADELDYTRGSILVQAERFSEAAEVLDRLIARSPYGPHTQDADLLRAYSLGKLAASDPIPARQDAYAAALAAHRARYPQTPTAAEATALLAACEESRGQWTSALTLYQSLADDPERGTAAQARIIALYEHVLATLREQSQPDDDWEDRAVEDVAAFVRRYPASVEQRTLAQVDATLRLARLVIEHREHLYTEADKLLTAALLTVAHQRRSADRDGAPLADEWTQLERTAQQWRMVSLAGQGRMDEAKQVFRDLSAAAPLALLDLLDGLTALAAVIPPEHRQDLGHLQLDAAQKLRLQQPELTDDQRRSLEAAIADAYLATGNVLNALDFYERLLAATPRDPHRLRTVAELCRRTGDAASLRRAKGYWQRLEGLETKGSPAWLEARLNVAECAVQLGQRDEARKLVALTRLVYPELGGGELQSRFSAVERAAAP